tara:strand:- start:1118 stop:1390 length:273 start_codon:yes stop_codon:yes gene_type:complete
VFTGVGQGNDGKRWNNIALEVRELVVTRKGDSAINRVDFVALLMPFRSSPFLETTGWDDGPLRVKPIFQSGVVPKLPDQALKVLYFGEGR